MKDNGVGNNGYNHQETDMMNDDRHNRTEARSKKGVTFDTMTQVDTDNKEQTYTRTKDKDGKVIEFPLMDQLVANNNLAE